MWLTILFACNNEQKPQVSVEDTVIDLSSDSGTEDTGSQDIDGEDTDAEPEEEVIPPKIVRFVALGDGGEGNETQYTVAASMKSICDAKSDELPGCEFALYLGDNIYDVGVDSVLDEQFYDKFEAPYAEIDFPFYVVLGNHDAGCWGAGCELYKTEYEVDYTNYSDKWKMFDQYYRVDVEHLTLFGLDTNAIMWDPWFSSADDQKIWFDNEISNTNDWKIAFGHHPYISNGRHGNAGSYEGLSIDWAVADVPLGTAVKEFMYDRSCGQIDVYFAGTTMWY